MNNVEKPTQPAHPQPVLQVKLTAMSDGSVNVTGFPTNLPTALNLLAAAYNAIIDHFITQAKTGNLDDNNTIIPKKIFERDKRLVDGAGRPLQ